MSVCCRAPILRSERRTSLIPSAPLPTKGVGSFNLRASRLSQCHEIQTLLFKVEVAATGGNSARLLFFASPRSVQLDTFYPNRRTLCRAIHPETRWYNSTCDDSRHITASTTAELPSSQPFATEANCAAVGLRFLPPEQGPQPDTEGQAEPRPGQRHFSIPTIDSGIEAAAPTYSRELRGDRPPEQRYSTHILPPSQAPPPPIEKEPKRGFRDRLGIGHSSKTSVDQGQNRATGLGRTLSVRRKDSSNPDKFQSPTEELQRGLRGNSSSQLLVHSEEEESQHNQFGIHHSYPGSVLPVTDQAQNTAYVQGPPQQQGQLYYPPPPTALQLVDADNSLQSTPEAFSSAGQHVAYLSEGQGPLQPFPPPPGQQELQQDAYQASPIGLGVSASPFQGPHNTASPYAFQVQPQDSQIAQARQQLAQQQDPQSAFSGRSSLEVYQKQQPQQQYYPSPDPQRLPQTRISSNTTAPNQDPAYLQAHQGTSTAIVEPPSPLQQPVPDHQISSQPGSQEPSPTDSQTGASTGTAMPTGQPRGASMRQLDKALPPPARESSMLGQRDAQAAPGVQAFNSNVVPIGSRGQPYREGAQETDDRGRDSPTRDMTQDDVENYMRLLKEHKELSKYIACCCS